MIGHRPGASLLALAFVAGCGVGNTGFQTTMNAWQSGQRSPAVAAATDEYTRFRDGNDLSEATVREAADAARAVLSTTPVVPIAGPAPDVHGSTSPHALTDALREDLLSGRATATMRAAAAVGALGLARHGIDLIVVIYRQQPFEADGALLADTDVALRSLAVKRIALDALEALATAR